MNVDKHLLNDLKPLRLDQPVNEILDLMEELKFSHLPVCADDNFYLGIVCEDDMLEAGDDDQPLKNYQHFLKPYSVLITSDVLDAIRLSGEGNLSLVPVMDKEGKYRGYLSPLELLQDLGRKLTFMESGSSLVLELPVRDFQLSQISQIVESEDARIIGLLMDSGDSIENVELTLKLNQRDLTRILKSLERYSYKVKEVHHESMFDDTLDQRYQSLMKYLKI